MFGESPFKNRQECLMVEVLPEDMASKYSLESFFRLFCLIINIYREFLYQFVKSEVILGLGYTS